MLLECPHPLGNNYVLQSCGIEAGLAHGLRGVSFIKTVGLVWSPHQTFRAWLRITSSAYSRKKLSKSRESLGMIVQ